MTKIQKLKKGHVFNGGRHKLSYDENSKEFVIKGENIKGDVYERRYVNGHKAISIFNTVSRNV